MIFIYILIGILFFIFLVWKNKHKDFDDVICVCYLLFSVFWAFYIPFFFMIFVFNKIANPIRGESK